MGRLYRRAVNGRRRGCFKVKLRGFRRFLFFTGGLLARCRSRTGFLPSATSTAAPAAAQSAASLLIGLLLPRCGFGARSRGLGVAVRERRNRA